LGATAVIVPAEGELDDVEGVKVFRCAFLAEAIETARRDTL
jgi:hypothetical protein